MIFKKDNSFESRKSESDRILDKYPDRIPIICEKNKSANNDIPYLDKIKYLIPNNLTIGQFIYVIRSRMKLPSEKAIFLFVNGSIPSSSELISLIYENNKDRDGFLYITYSGENTFGFNN